MSKVGCLLGETHCGTKRHIPDKNLIPPSPAPPDAKNKQYQELAMQAESVVPKTWWREGFSNELLLLTRNNSDLPRKQFDAGSLANKKLKNIYQCVTRQQFIRKSFEFRNENSQTGSKCANERVVLTFFQLWKNDSLNMGGEYVNDKISKQKLWYPSQTGNGQLQVAASEVLEYFYKNYGGVWTGCFKLEKDSMCRGALAAAALVIAMNFIADIAGKQKSFSESHFIRGYILASLGRGLLHGESSNTGNEPTTNWMLKCADFIGMQAAFLKLYIDTYGAEYTKQLNSFIPLAFPPSFQVHSKPEWKQYANSLEPVYSSLRNWMFHEAANLIDFGPYRPLVAFQEVRQNLLRTKKRRILIDVGANGFFASPKYLLDSYAPYLPFDQAIMIEPEPHFSSTVPKVYSKRYNITFLQIYAEVATNSSTDMLKIIPNLVTKDDFVVLKFDVDPNRYAYGPTMEWGFLFSIMQNPQIASLVDEVYIELHFHFPSLYWKHYHSNWEALDAMRYLRNQGAIVHSWP